MRSGMPLPESFQGILRDGWLGKTFFEMYLRRKIRRGLRLLYQIDADVGREMEKEKRNGDQKRLQKRFWYHSLRVGGCQKECSKNMIKLDFSHIENKKKYYEFYKKVGEKAPSDQQAVIARIGNFFPYLEDPIIEFGCSSGYNLIKCVELGFTSITGVDCSPTYIKKARKRTKNFPQIILIESFIEDLPENKKYNTIILTEILEHVIDVNLVLKKARNLLNENGYIFITAPSKRCGPSGHVRGVNQEEITRWLKKHNLKIFKWFPSFQWVPPNFPWEIADYPPTIRLIAQHEK